MQMAVGTVIIADLPYCDEWLDWSVISIILVGAKDSLMLHRLCSSLFFFFLFSFFFFMLRVLRSGEKKNYIPIL